MVNKFMLHARVRVSYTRDLALTSRWQLEPHVLATMSIVLGQMQMLALDLK